MQHVAMLHRSNILALVGGGRDPLDSSNKGLLSEIESINNNI